MSFRIIGHARGRVKIAAIICGAIGWLVLFDASVEPAAAQRFRIPRKHSAWGRFRPGSWQRVRITTETLSEDEQVETIATTDRKSTLVAVDDEGVTLRIESAVEVAGRSFEAPVQTVRYGFSGEPMAGDQQEEVLTPLEDATVEIEGEQVHCQVGQIERRSEEGYVVTQVYYSPQLHPYILRRETTVRDDESREVMTRETAQTVWLEMPQRVGPKLRSAAMQSVLRRDTRGTTRLLRWLSAAVPGELVAARSKEFDSQGRILRRSLTELVDYHVVEE